MNFPNNRPKPGGLNTKTRHARSLRKPEIASGTLEGALMVEGLSVQSYRRVPFESKPQICMQPSHSSYRWSPVNRVLESHPLK